MKPKLFAIVLCVFSALQMSSCSDKDPKEINKRIEILHQSLRQHSMDSLRPYLAPGYTVKGLPEGLEPFVLPTVFEKFSTPTRYEITGNATEKHGTRLRVTFYFEQMEPLKANFLLTSDGRFLELNLLENAKVQSTVDPTGK